MADRAPDQLREPSPAIVYSLMGVMTLAWGSTWLVIKQGLGDLPPLFGAGVRFVVAGSVMALLAPWLARKEGGGRPPFPVVLTQTTCQFVLNFALVYYAETILPSGIVSVLWAVFPFLIALSGHFVTKSERLSGRQWAGVSLGLVGIFTLFATDIAGISRRAIVMALLLLLAPLSVTFSTLLIKLRAAGSSSVLLNRDSMLLGAVGLLGLSFAFEPVAEARFTPAAVGSVLYLALVGSVLTFGVYLWLLRSVPAYRLSLVSYATPVLALWLGASVGGEPVGVTTLLGSALVVMGVALTLRRARAPARDADELGAPGAGGS